MQFGTMVMLNVPSSILITNKDFPPNGAIGEVVDTTAAAKAEMPVGDVAVHFPRNLSVSNTQLWTVPPVHLIPLSGPDILIEECERSPVEENVN